MFFENWKELPPGNPFGYMPVSKLIEILQGLPEGSLITTGCNSLPVMTVMNPDLEQIGMIEPHHESFKSFANSEADEDEPW